MGRVAVIGGGASGMIAAIRASENNEVVLFEKNEKLGKKIYITGKGRCNVTNDCEKEEFLHSVVSNPKFLMSALNNFTPQDLMDFLEMNGLTLKVERGNRVFPLSDKASDVTAVFAKKMKECGVDVRLNEKVDEISVLDGSVNGVKTEKGFIPFDKVIVCTGGKSYPSTGSTGDGYRFAEKAGHTVVTPVPSLVGLNLKGDDFKSCQGLSLKNVELSVFRGEKKIFSDFGEMLFTHFGISGPIVLSSSCVLCRERLSDIKVVIDLKPALTKEKLDERLLRDFEANSNKNFINVLPSLVPKSLFDLIIQRTRISANRKINGITAQERERLVSVLKGLTFSVASLRPFEEAIVTSGGVSVKEVNPKTMESKLVKGLYFAGEVLDVDAFTGGFNLQIAFSTGVAAGEGACRD